MTKTLSSLAVLALLAATGCNGSSARNGAAASSAVPPVSSVSVGSAPPASRSAPTSAAGSPTSAAGSATSSPASPTPGQTAVAAEKNPPGDIPDSVAFVPYDNAAGHYHLTHPEGWAETTTGSTVTFTDKLNGVQAMAGADSVPPTGAVAKQRDVPQLSRTQSAFELRSVKVVTEPAGAGVLIVYRRNSAPDPVTGRQYRDEVERYELVGHGRSVVLEFFGPVGADNVDAYRTMAQSLRLS